jgi:taurine dioxygenase
MIAFTSSAVNVCLPSADARAALRSGRPAVHRALRYDDGMALQTRPLTSGFGVEALDLDLSQPLSEADFAEIEQAFFRGQVLVVRAQTLTPAQFATWARRFGTPEPHVIDQFHHPADPNILILSNRVRDGRPAGLADAGTYFHTDYSYLPVPARATTLYSIEVPRQGGNTLFANQYAAYDDLTAAMKARIDPLVGVHHYGNRHNLDVTTRTVASVLSVEQEASLPLVAHRIARPHPVTGRKALYAVNGSSFGIVGMPDDEARDLLDELAAHATQPKYQLSYTYGVGDVVIWDNASLLHSATLVDPAQPRTLWRITIREPLPGAAGTALAETFSAAGTM